MVGHTSTEESDDEDVFDEEAPLSPTTPALNASFRRPTTIPQARERMPLSPENSSSKVSGYGVRKHFQMETPQPKQLDTGEGEHDDSDNDEYTPLSPTTPSMHSAPQTPIIHSASKQNRRFNTPNFLTPGTFRRWRHDDGIDPDGAGELPEMPLMTSPNLNKGENYFGHTISPSWRGKPAADESDNSSYVRNEEIQLT